MSLSPNELHSGQTVYYSCGWEVREMRIDRADIWGGVWACERTPWGCYGEPRRVEPKFLHKRREDAQAEINKAVQAIP